MPGNRTPRVRVVVVNYNGGDHVVKCVEHLLRTDWPSDAFEVVVVDNASVDGSGDTIEHRFPDVQVIRTPVNVGFAGGNNSSLRDLDEVDVVALVNNDAFVEPGWLAPLVAALDDADVGAATAKVVFAPRFLELTLSTDPSEPTRDDDRHLGVKIVAIECEGTDVWAGSEFGSGFHGPEIDPDGRPACWTAEEATLWIGLPDDAEPPVSVRLRVGADRVKPLRLAWAGSSTTAHVGTDPAWVEVKVNGEPTDIVNNAGNVLLDGGYGADRGFRQADRGQYDQPCDVFAWCGAAVALKREYLDDVGLFDDDFHLYYEDFDLAWRGRLLGWRYRYVPASVVRHMHATTTQEGSALFDHYVRRNRLLTLTKNAPRSLVVAAVVDDLRELARTAAREIVRPLVRLQRPSPDFTRRRLRSLLAFLRHLPRAMWKRRRIGRTRRTSRQELMRWMRDRS